MTTDRGQEHSQPSKELTDDELLSGLWWSDSAFHASTGVLWERYVQRKHEWEAYRRGIANVLRDDLREVEKRRGN